MRTKPHSARAIVVLALLAVLVVIAMTIILLRDLRRKELEHALTERDAVADLFVKRVKHDLNSISLVLKIVQGRMESACGASSMPRPVRCMSVR